MKIVACARLRELVGHKKEVKSHRGKIDLQGKFVKFQQNLVMTEAVAAGSFVEGTIRGKLYVLDLYVRGLMQIVQCAK